MARESCPYLRDLARYPVLSHREQQDLAVSARKGDAAARQRLVLSNLRLVVRVARRYRQRGLSFLDLIGEGNLGLVKAADRFDAGRGVHFTTYAVCWIRGMIQHALRRSGTLPPPPTRRALVKAAQRPDQILSRAMEREWVRGRLSLLEAREREVLRLRYGLGTEEALALRAVGARIGLCGERVRQIEAKAIEKLTVMRPEE